jgi:hypothetical protein
LPPDAFHQYSETGTAVDSYLARHPGRTVAALGKLRTMLAMASIDMAAHQPAFGATLLQRLQVSHRPPDSDADLVAEFLTHTAPSVAAPKNFTKIAMIRLMAAGRAGRRTRHRASGQAAWPDGAVQLLNTLSQ